jgi:hypothetical protein
MMPTPSDGTNRGGDRLYVNVERSVQVFPTYDIMEAQVVEIAEEKEHNDGPTT